MPVGNRKRAGNRATLGESRPLLSCQQWQQSKAARGTKNPRAFKPGSVSFFLASDNMRSSTTGSSLGSKSGILQEEAQGNTEHFIIASLTSQHIE
jgi:hypothetical protein